MEIQCLEDKCSRCMLCVRDCVSTVWRDVDGVPVPVAPELCNLCSHCLAICPKTAIEHSKLDPEQVRSVKKSLLNSKAYREIVLSRRSIRQYKDKPVPRSVIEDIIDMARYSPTASNLQNVRYTIVTDRELIKKISRKIFSMGVAIYRFFQNPFGKILMKLIGKTSAGLSVIRYMDAMDYYIQETDKGRDFILHGAPVLILILAPKKARFACDNCSISAANITNYAHALNLGTCYTGFLTLKIKYDRTIRRWLEIPKSQRVFSSLVMGYPLYSHSSTVSRKQPPINWLMSTE